MKRLAIVSVLALAACSESRTTGVNGWVPNLTLKSEQGAGFSPYSRGEWDARIALGQPGLVPYQEPISRRTTFEDFRREQAASQSRGSEGADRVGTLVELAKRQPQRTIFVGDREINVAKVTYNGEQFAVARSPDGGWGGRSALRAEDNIRVQLPQIIGCESDGTTEAVFGPGVSAELVFGLNCA